MRGNSNPSLGGMNQGYGSRNQWKLKSKEIRKYTNYGAHDQKFPSGNIPPILLSIITILVIGLSLGLKSKGTSDADHQVFLAHAWYNVVWYILGASNCIIALWAIGRTGMFASLRFGILKFNRVLKIDVLKEKITKHDYALYHITNFEEYEDFLKRRRKETKKPFLITWVTYLSIFVAWTVIMSVLNAVLNK